MMVSAPLPASKITLAYIGFTILHFFVSGNYASGQMQSSNTVARLIRYEVKPEFNTAFRLAVSNYILHSLELQTNILSEAYYEEADTTVIWIIERWNTKDDLEKARKAAEFRTIESLSRTSLKQPLKTIFIKDLEPLSKQQWRTVARKEDLPLTIMLFVDAKQGTQDKFKDVYHDAMPQFRGEPGVINYQLSQLEEDSTRFVTYEKFRNEDAFQYHLDFPPILPVIDFLNTSIKKQPFQDGLHRLIEFAPLSVSNEINYNNIKNEKNEKN